MASLLPKEFIEQIFIVQLEEIVSKHHHHYIAFMVMSAGIDFLGKCMDTKSKDWNKSSLGPSKLFDKAVNELNALSKYRQYLKTHRLYNSLRCGLLHSASPKREITLSSGNEMPHMTIHGTRLNLKCEDFFVDFKFACEEVIAQSFNASDKMNQPFLEIPGNKFDQETHVAMGITGSLHP